MQCLGVVVRLSIVPDLWGIVGDWVGVGVRVKPGVRVHNRVGGRLK